MKNGQSVKAHYKSGIYLGEVVEDRGHSYLVKVLAVEKHPMQGDLHNPGQTEGVFFHQRKALSYLEKANVQKEAVHVYEGMIPEYEVSLRESINKLYQKLDRRDTEFNKMARQNLEDLEKHYFS